MFKSTFGYLNSDCRKLLVKTMSLSVTNTIETGWPWSLKTLPINACSKVCTTNESASGMK